MAEATRVRATWGSHEGGPEGSLAAHPTSSWAGLAVGGVRVLPVYLLTGLPMDAQSDLNIPVFIVVFLPSAESRVSVREMSTDATSSCAAD